jgi:hypothetical protein
MFMNKIVLSFICVAIGLVSVAQEKVVNDPHAQVRQAKAFHAIKISNGIDLYLTQSKDEAVAVSASSEKYREKIRTEVENGVLNIFLEKEPDGFSWSWGNQKLKAYVSFKDLETLTASGGSDVFLESDVSLNKLDINLSGGSDLKGKVAIQELSLHQTGGSDIHISGTVNNLHVEASGGSDLHGFDLVADACTVHASGGSDMRITVNKTLSADASGGSDIYYKGSGVVKAVQSSGSSSISKRG